MIFCAGSGRLETGEASFVIRCDFFDAVSVINKEEKTVAALDAHFDYLHIHTSSTT